MVDCISMSLNRTEMELFRLRCKACQSEVELQVRRAAAVFIKVSEERQERYPRSCDKGDERQAREYLMTIIKVGVVVLAELTMGAVVSSTSADAQPFHRGGG